MTHIKLTLRKLIATESGSSIRDIVTLLLPSTDLVFNLACQAGVEWRELDPNNNFRIELPPFPD